MRVVLEADGRSKEEGTEKWDFLKASCTDERVHIWRMRIPSRLSSCYHPRKVAILVALLGLALEFWPPKWLDAEAHALGLGV